MHDGIVLIVDDVSEVRKVVGQQLRLVGINNEPASTATEALDRIRRGGVSVVLLDQNLGQGGDGTELVPKIRGIDPDMAIVFLTGFPDTTADFPDIQLIEKPYKARDLVAKIRHELKTRCRDQKVFETHSMASETKVLVTATQNMTRSTHLLIEAHVAECRVDRERYAHLDTKIEKAVLVAAKAERRTLGELLSHYKRDPFFWIFFTATFGIIASWTAVQWKDFKEVKESVHKIEQKLAIP